VGVPRYLSYVPRRRPTESRRGEEGVPLGGAGGRLGGGGGGVAGGGSRRSGGIRPAERRHDGPATGELLLAS
jgi:hypothetical protein